MNLDHDFFQVSKLSKDQKKRSSPKLKGFYFHSSEDQKKKQRSSPHLKDFFPRIQAKTSAQMHTRVKLLGGMQM